MSDPFVRPTIPLWEEEPDPFEDWGPVPFDWNDDDIPVNIFGETDEDR
jgi:hypothetical protein